jgi:hypothetical protein
MPTCGASWPLPGRAVVSQSVQCHASTDLDLLFVEINHASLKAANPVNWQILLFVFRLDAEETHKEIIAFPCPCKQCRSY